MRRLPRVALLVAFVAVVPVLAGCSNFDPDSMDFLGLNSKKKLPGKRELLFPNGVPGVSQGIPPEYQEGYKEPAIGDLPPGDADATANAGQPATAKSAPVHGVRESNLGKPKAVHKRTVSRRAKPRHHVVKRKPVEEPRDTATVKPGGTTAPWPSTPPQQAAEPQTGANAPWPSAQPQQPPQQQETQAGWPGGQPQQPKLAPWPSAPPPGSFSK